MAPSVTYLGHRIDLEGLYPSEDKIQAIRDTPAPHNVTAGPPILPVTEGHLLEVGNRSLFSVSTSERVITDELCPGPL